jgi:hypothetical protein
MLRAKTGRAEEAAGEGPTKMIAGPGVGLATTVTPEAVLITVPVVLLALPGRPGPRARANNLVGEEEVFIMRLIM